MQKAALAVQAAHPMQKAAYAALASVPFSSNQTLPPPPPSDEDEDEDSASDPPVPQSLIEPSLRSQKRGLTLEEVLRTEKDYVRDLRVMTTVYQQQLERKLTAADLDVLLHPNLDSLYQLHTELLRLLEAAAADAVLDLSLIHI